MFSALSLSEKWILVAVAGPFVHRGIEHLLENLVFLLLFGRYIELNTGKNRVYKLVFLIGYPSSWTSLILIDGAGAVGASSVIEGMKMVTGAIALVALGSELHLFEKVVELPRTLIHVFPLVFGIGLGWKTIATLTPSSGVTEIIHAIGAFYGIVIGGLYLSKYLPEVLHDLQQDIF